MKHRHRASNECISGKTILFTGNQVTKTLEALMALEAN